MPAFKNILRFRIGMNASIHLPQPHDSDRILSRRDFTRLLDHERSRADRSGRAFSLIVFALQQIARDKQSLQLFLKMLIRRVRETESIGWIQDNSVLGIILPDTPFSGADKLAHDILSLGAKTYFRPAFRIYTYPSNWLSGAHEHDRFGFDQVPTQNNASSDTQDNREEGDGLNQLVIPKMPLWKRVIDIIGAIVGLAILSPLFFSIAVLIKTVSPGPVFFKQERVGFLGRHFTCWKFRTMDIEADSRVHQVHVSELCKNGQPLEKLDDRDPRIIPFGKILRKTGLDELPQLINVLCGEMSLIGPRPDVPYSVAQYLPWQNKRFETYPGLTGLWQVNGKNTTTFNEMMRLDISYVKNRSFGMDAIIFLKTIPAIIQQTRARTSH